MKELFDHVPMNAAYKVPMLYSISVLICQLTKVYTMDNQDDVLKIIGEVVEISSSDDYPKHALLQGTKEFCHLNDDANKNV
jgi:hypothetical protein